MQLLRLSFDTTHFTLIFIRTKCNTSKLICYKWKICIMWPIWLVPLDLKNSLIFRTINLTFKYVTTENCMIYCFCLLENFFFKFFFAPGALLNEKSSNLVLINETKTGDKHIQETAEDVENLYFLFNTSFHSELLIEIYRAIQFSEAFHPLWDLRHKGFD